MVSKETQIKEKLRLMEEHSKDRDNWVRVLFFRIITCKYNITHSRHTPVSKINTYR